MLNFRERKAARGNIYLSRAPEPRQHRKGWNSVARHYGIAVLFVTLALLIWWPIEHWLKPASLALPMQFLLMLSAVTAAGILGGLGPSLLAAALGTLAGKYIVHDPHPQNNELCLLMGAGLLLSLMAAWLHRALRRAESGEITNLQLEQQLLETSDSERQTIGHDLHDGLGQQLTGISLLSKVLTHRLQVSQHPSAGQSAEISMLVNDCIGWTRDLARLLSPVALERDGFMVAVKHMTVNSHRLLGVEAQFQTNDEELVLDQTTSLHLYRVIQEAMNNAVRHGKAKMILVTVMRQEDILALTVTDDGCGLSARTALHPGIGLRIMQYRARMLGATLTASRTSPTGGTTVTCILKMPADRKVSVNQDEVHADGQIPQASRFAGR